MTFKRKIICLGLSFIALSFAFLSLNFGSKTVKAVDTTTIPSDITLGYFLDNSKGYNITNTDFSNGLLWLKSVDNSNVDGNNYYMFQLNFSDSSYLRVETGTYSGDDSNMQCFYFANNNTYDLYDYNIGVQNIALRFGDNITLVSFAFLGSGFNSLGDITITENSDFTGTETAFFSHNLGVFVFGFAPANTNTVYIHEQNSYDSGYDQGYYLGYETAMSSQSSSINDAYNRGYQRGVADEQSDQNNAYNNGYSAGYDVAKVEYQTAYDEGVASVQPDLLNEYNRGYSKGVNDANKYTFFSLFGSIGDSIVNIFEKLLGFDFLGFNVLNLVKALLTIFIVISAFKVVLGGL